MSAERFTGVEDTLFIPLALESRCPDVFLSTFMIRRP